MKFFKEDLWHSIEDLFLKLNIDEVKSLALFKAFLVIDIDESNTVDREECYKYFGGNRTKFNDRIFYSTNEIDDKVDIKGMDFQTWSITVWNFCTLNNAQLSRFLFEIFDVNNVEILERGDVETMYRMVYDCDDYDDKYMSYFVFDEKKQITKNKFISICTRCTHWIWPIIDYQRRIRKKTLGVGAWESLMGYRRRNFLVYDTSATTIEQAVRTIMLADDPNKRRKLLEAERLMAEQRVMLREDEELAEARLLEQETLEREDALKLEMSFEAVDLKRKCFEFEQQKKAFDDTDFSLSDVWLRRERRLRLFELLLEYRQASEAYWAVEERRAVHYMDPCDGGAELQLRYEDMLNTEDGKLWKELLAASYCLQEMLATVQANKAKGKSANSKSAKEIEIAASLVDVRRAFEYYDAQCAEKTRREYEPGPDPCLAILQQFARPAAGDGDGQPAAPVLREKRNMKYQNALNITNKCATKELISRKDLEADIHLKDLLHERLVAGTKERLQQDADQRSLYFSRREFDLSCVCGSKITSWETVFDPAVMKLVRLNVDTLQTLPCSEAICETCDAVIALHDPRCLDCGGARSEWNMRLYRPLGSKEVLAD